MEKTIKYTPQKVVKGRKKASQHETNQQIACVNWFTLQFQKYAHLLYSIPNEGERSLIGNVTMNRMGRRKGFPDMGLALPRGRYPGLYIENKFLTGKTSPQQEQYHKWLVQAGYCVVECWSFDEFVRDVTWYMSLGEPVLVGANKLLKRIQMHFDAEFANLDAKEFSEEIQDFFNSQILK